MTQDWVKPPPLLEQLARRREAGEAPVDAAIAVLNAGRAANPTVRAAQAANEPPSPLQKDAAHWTLQLAIVALTVPGMWIITGTAEVRYGYVVLLAAQPFWLLAHWRERQWGMFAIALVFSALWLRGIFNHFPY